jgi:hypothetical protein
MMQRTPKAVSLQVKYGDLSQAWLTRRLATEKGKSTKLTRAAASNVKTSAVTVSCRRQTSFKKFRVIRSNLFTATS